MAKLIMMRGLPASGKSTRAEVFIHNSGYNIVRLNSDLLRTMLNFDHFSFHTEKVVNQALNELARKFLNDKTSVIIDNTNLGDKHLERWKTIAKECDAEFCIEDLSHVPVSVCVHRDLNRKDKAVGSGVIMRMAMRYQMIDLGSVILCDLDGTICDTSKRVHFVQQHPKDWDSFYAGIPEDKIRHDVLSHLNPLLPFYSIVFVSARPEKYRKITEEWLTSRNIPGIAVLMRRDGDHRPDHQIKREILHTYFPDKTQIKFVLDDRPSVIRMWREEGLEVIDVGNGIEF